MRPADGGAELCADAATGGKDAGPVEPRQVENDTDVASLAHPTRAHHGRGERLVELEPESEHERARSVIHREAVTRTVDVLREQGLGDVVPARGELIEHFALGYEPHLLELVECTRALHDLEHARPVDRARCGFAA